MRIILAIMTVLFLVSPGLASGQTFSLHGSGGPTMVDRGYSLAAGLGFSPTSWLTFTVDVERTHLVSRRTGYPGGFSQFRGGTTTLVATALRVTPLGGDRIGPYGLAGLATGVSRPNVTDVFPDQIRTDVRAPFFGGGFQVPLKNRVTLFAEARMMLVVGTEADDLFAVAPIRAGVAWRF